MNHGYWSESRCGFDVVDQVESVLFAEIRVPLKEVRCKFKLSLETSIENARDELLVVFR